jgi:hypothetical protein
MRENRQSGSEGGGSEANRFSLPLYQAAEPQDIKLGLQSNKYRHGRRVHSQPTLSTC